MIRTKLFSKLNKSFLLALALSAFASNAALASNSIQCKITSTGEEDAEFGGVLAGNRVTFTRNGLNIRLEIRSDASDSGRVDILASEVATGKEVLFTSVTTQFRDPQIIKLSNTTEIDCQKIPGIPSWIPTHVYEHPQP